MAVTILLLPLEHAFEYLYFAKFIRAVYISVPNPCRDDGSVWEPMVKSLYWATGGSDGHSDPDTYLP